ncbi:recombinase family protein [Micromonospora fulviviridis]|uniref:Recombinase family protein n=1 Tax=Micromonospora fulviviridis TaxID=47860 RepID=A0ABV2VUK7_9ACTN
MSAAEGVFGQSEELDVGGAGGDPDTAPIVRRIFDEFLAGYGLFAIAEGLSLSRFLCKSPR